MIDKAPNWEAQADCTKEEWKKERGRLERKWMDILKGRPSTTGLKKSELKQRLELFLRLLFDKDLNELTALEFEKDRQDEKSISDSFQRPKEPNQMSLGDGLVERIESTFDQIGQSAS